MNAKEIVFIILTHDERENIARSINSVRDLGPVVVVDSGSSDGTQDVATSLGAEVVGHAWEGFARQRNFAMNHIDQGDWFFFLDADEQLDHDLKAELRGLNGEHGAYRVRRKNYFLGRHLRYAGRYPDWQLRLVRRGAASFEDRSVHERILFDGRVGFLNGHIIHDSAAGMRRMIDKHVNYAQLEAAEIERSSIGSGWLFSRDRQRRRRWVKERIWFRLPFRGAIRIVWLLMLRGGILDGRAGITYARMLAAYEAHIDCFRLANKFGARSSS